MSTARRGTENTGGRKGEYDGAKASCKMEGESRNMSRQDLDWVKSAIYSTGSGKLRGGKRGSTPLLPLLRAIAQRLQEWQPVPQHFFVSCGCIAIFRYHDLQGAAPEPTCSKIHISVRLVASRRSFSNAGKSPWTSIRGTLHGDLG